MTPRRAILAAVFAFLLVNVAFVGTRPVLSPDETRYGSIAVQMVESGDWLAMRMSGFHFYEKPALVYWMMAASVSVFGENAFAIRLPAALCGGLAALAIGLAARRGARLAGAAPPDATVTGALVALCALTMVLPAVGSSVAIFDQPIAGFVTAACALFFIGATEPAGRTRLAWLLASGIAAGLAFMTKGLLAFAFPAMTVVPWLLWERRWRDAFVLPLVPIVVALLVAAPWAVAVHRHEPGFWERFIVHEHFQRFAGTVSNQPREPWAFYLLIVPLGCVPWIAAAPAAVRWWPALARASTGVRFAICAAIGPLLFLSASRGKLPTYALPLFPPLAWLIVVGLQQAFVSKQPADAPAPAPGRLALLPGAILLLAGVVALGFAFAGDASLPLLSRAWLTQPHARAGLLGAALILWGLGDWRAQRAPAGPARLAWMGLSPVALLASFGLLLPDAAVSELEFPARTLTAEQATIDAAPTLFCDYKMAHACAWTLRRTDFLVVGDPREFANGLGIPAEDARMVDNGALPARVASARAQGAVAMAAQTAVLDRLLKLPGMPAPAARQDHRGWALVTFDAASPAPAPAAPNG
jgi:4-amino-4-deoxy-L-arabinose transferase